MRWVKAMVIIAIVAAIIPTMIMVINRLPSEYKTEREEYEIRITEDNVAETVYELYNLVKLDENNKVTNLSSGRVVNKEAWSFDITAIYYRTDSSRYFEVQYYDTRIPAGTKKLYLDLDDPVGRFNTNFRHVTIHLYDEKAVKLPSSLELILISLTPLILVSGLIIYQYKELELNKNE